MSEKKPKSSAKPDKTPRATTSNKAPSGKDPGAGKKKAAANKAGASSKQAPQSPAEKSAESPPEQRVTEVAAAAVVEAPKPVLSQEVEIVAKPPKKKAAQPEYVQEFDGKWTKELEDSVIEHMAGYLESEGEEDEGPPQLSLLTTLTPESIQEFMLGKRALGDLFGLTAQEAYSIAKFGLNYLDGGKFPEAEAIFKGLVTMMPKDAYFHTCLGAVYQRWGKRDIAIEEYTASLILEPTDIDARVNRGELNLLKGRVAEGLEDLKVAVTTAEASGRVSPALNRARALAAMVALAMKEKLEARESP